REQLSARAFNFNFSGVSSCELLGVRLFRSAQQKRTLIKLCSEPCVFLLQTMALAFNQHQACSQRLNFCRYLALALFDLIQLFMLIDALTSLPVAQQHSFSRRSASTRQFVFQMARFLGCSTRRVLSFAEIVGNALLE